LDILPLSHIVPANINLRLDYSHATLSHLSFIVTALLAVTTLSFAKLSRECE